jgi:hypothetical protein
MRNLGSRGLAAGIFTITLATGCSSGTSSGGSGSGGSSGGGMPSAPPDAFVNAGVGGGSTCTGHPSLGEFFQLGTATAGHPDTVQDGGQDRNANVSVTCTVHPQGSGFDIALSAVTDGPNGGSLVITSPPGRGAVTTMPSSGISASFLGAGGVVYREDVGASDPTGCTITYAYDPGGSVGGVAGDSPVPVTPPIAAGRIWGHIKCPNAAAAAMGTACDAEADFMFEQCSQ